MDLEFYRRKWHEIHSKASQVNRRELSHRKFCEWMRVVPDDLPCSICRGHAKEYIRDNPPEFIPDIFVWSWNFHNAVNIRKKKPLVSYEEAAYRYGV